MQNASPSLTPILLRRGIEKAPNVDAHAKVAVVEKQNQNETGLTFRQHAEYNFKGRLEALVDAL